MEVENINNITESDKVLESNSEQQFNCSNMQDCSNFFIQMRLAQAKITRPEGGASTKDVYIRVSDVLAKINKIIFEFDNDLIYDCDFVSLVCEAFLEGNTYGKRMNIQKSTLGQDKYVKIGNINNIVVANPASDELVLAAGAMVSLSIFDLLPFMHIVDFEQEKISFKELEIRIEWGDLSTAITNDLFKLTNGYFEALPAADAPNGLVKFDTTKKSMLELLGTVYTGLFPIKHSVSNIKKVSAINKTIEFKPEFECLGLIIMLVNNAAASNKSYFQEDKTEAIKKITINNLIVYDTQPYTEDEEVQMWSNFLSENKIEFYNNDSLHNSFFYQENFAAGVEFNIEILPTNYAATITNQELYIIPIYHSTQVLNDLSELQKLESEMKNI